jgi:collagenase-like PrtC family protease
MKNPQIITYAENKKTIAEALKIGLGEIILSTDNKKIIDLANYAKKLDPNILLSFNFDFFLKDKNLTQIIKTLKILKTAKITKIRIKDIGLLEITKKYLPEAKIFFTNETVNLNSESVSAYANFFSGQTLSHLLSLKELKQIISQCESNFEILAQGQILLHHSAHKFIQKKAAFLEDTDHPKHLLPYKENKNGFYLYNFYHRNLMSYLPQIKKLNLAGLIIDLRGYPLSYLKTALLNYKNALSSTSKTINVGVIPQKPGFFKANRFDYRPYSIYQETKRTKKIYGQIQDTLNKKWLVIETYFPIKIGHKFKIITPENKIINLEISEMENIADNLFKVKFPKFVLTKSILVK